jgi:hypothetical protein
MHHHRFEMSVPAVCRIKGDKVSPLLRKQVKALTVFAQNTADALESVQAERDALKAERDALKADVLEFKARYHAYRYRYRECKAKLPRTGDTTVSIPSNGEMEQDLSGFDVPNPADDDGMVLKTDQPADDDEMMVAGGGGPGPYDKIDQSREEIASEAGTPKNDDDE